MKLNQHNPWPFPVSDKPVADISPAFTHAAEESAAHAALMQARIKQWANNEREGLLATAKENGVGLVHIYNTSHAFGGLTIAFKRSSEYANGVMVDVAVATCSHKDAFSKKLGVMNALCKWEAGEVISLPLLRYNDERDLAFVVKNAFTALYQEI